MLKVNEYFEGNVKSIALENKEGTATVGVIAAGEYEFGTSTNEKMSIVSGVLDVMPEGSTVWKTFSTGDTFVVEKNSKFKVKAVEPVAYYCLYY